LQGVCDNGAFVIPSLTLDDYSYIGPTGSGDATDLCKCNTVVYSLMSACDACQGANWFSWKTWKVNCTTVDPPQTYSNTIPSGTRVPEWAFIDVTKEGIWDPILAHQLGNQVEISPGEPATMTSLPTPTSSQTTVPGLSSSQAHFLSSKLHPNNMGRKTAAIVGGILSAIALVAASVALLLWRARVKRRRTTRAASVIIFGNQAMPMQEKVSRSQAEPRDAVPDAI